MKQFEQNGFVCVHNVFTSEINEIRNSMIDVFQEYTNDKSKSFNQLLFDLFNEDFDGYHGCANACQRILELTRLSASKKMQNILKDLGLRKPIVNTRPLVSFSSSRLAKHETYWKVPAHQDWYSMQGSINAITCWAPLIDVSNDMGPIEFSPGTHKNGPVDHDDIKVPLILLDNFEYVSVKLNAGDAVFFSPFTVHRSGNNKTKDQIRWSVHMRYDDAEEATFINRKYPYHRVDKRKEGILHPGFPSVELLKGYYDKFSREQAN